MRKAVKRIRIFALRLWRFFLTTVLGGIVVVLPLYLIFVVIRFIYGLMTQVIQPIKELFNYTDGGHQEWLINLIAIAGVVALFFFIGLFIRTNSGQQIFHFIENNWLRQIPFYSTIRDTVQAFFGNKKMPFQEVVLVDVFKNGSKMTGFVSEAHENGIVTVFVPTGPNPTNGFIFHIHHDQVEHINIKPEEAMRTIIGVGVGSSIIFDDVEKSKKMKQAPIEKNQTPNPRNQISKPK